MADWVTTVLVEAFLWILWGNQEDRSWDIYRIIVILCVLAGIAGLVYWLFLR